MTSTATDTRAGFTLRGEFLSIKDGKPWTGRDGEERTPVLVTVLVGDRPVVVEYRDQASAEAAVAEGGAADRGDAIAVPVFVRAKGKDWLSVSGLNLRSEG